MIHRWSALLIPVLILAGCTDADEPATGADGGTGLASAPAPGTMEPAPDRPLIVPILLEGSTATQAYVCVEAAPPCLHHAVVPGTSDLMLDGLAGRIEGGSLSLTWSAASPATQELAFGLMLMGGEGDECASVSLGLARGTSPLAIDIAPSERALCEGETLHAWASNGIYAGEPPAYAQLDLDQAFRLEGSVTFAP